MKILLTNDDGVNAPGLTALFAPLLADGHEIAVAAPVFDNSGVSHAITVHKPIFVDEYEFCYPDIQGWSVEGYPVDCVKLALEALLEDKPDFVISGINRGPNIGQDVIYSGTVQAAMEAAMHNIPALSVSLDSKSRKADYTLAAQITVKIVKNYKRLNIAANTVLNVNIPSMHKDHVKGVKVARLGNAVYENVFSSRENLDGRTYYWLGGNLINDGENKEPDTDLSAVNEGWITFTPLQYDMVNQNIFKKLKKRSFDNLF